LDFEDLSIENCDKDEFFKRSNGYLSLFEKYEVVIHMPEITIPFTTMPETTFSITTLPEATIQITTIPETTISISTSQIVPTSLTITYQLKLLTMHHMELKFIEKVIVTYPQELFVELLFPVFLHY